MTEFTDDEFFRGTAMAALLLQIKTLDALRKSGALSDMEVHEIIDGAILDA